jgi:hypothetical protein
MAAPQSAYDIYENSGKGDFFLRKVAQNNPDARPMYPVPQDFNLLGWTVDPMDLTGLTQAIVSGTQYFVRLNTPSNLNNANNNAISKVGLYLGSAALATPGTYSGLAVYSYTLGAATMTKLADTGADNGAAWVTSGPSAYFEAALSSKVQAGSGYLYLSFIATFTTTPTLWVATPQSNAYTIKGTKVQQTYSLASQTSFGATATISGLSAGTFIPLMGVASS